MFQKVLKDFITVEMLFHSRALEFLGKCYEDISAIDEYADLDVSTHFFFKPVNLVFRHHNSVGFQLCQQCIKFRVKMLRAIGSVFRHCKTTANTIRPNTGGHLHVNYVILPSYCWKLSDSNVIIVEIPLYYVLHSSLYCIFISIFIAFSYQHDYMYI